VRTDEPDVLSLIIRHVETTPDHEAVKDTSRSLTYAELGEEVRTVAGALEASGVGEGDRVALGLGNSVDFLVAALACCWLGAIFVPLPVGDPASRLQVILQSCEPAVVLVAGTGSGKPVATLPALPAGPCRVLSIEAARQFGKHAPSRLQYADRAAYCIYTSGTTGVPKGVLTGQAAFAAAAMLAVERMGLHPGTRALCVSPVHFVGSFGTVFPVVVAGGSLVIPARESLALPRMFFRIVARERITHTSFSPTYLRLLLGSPELGRLASSSLVTMAFGGETLAMTDLRPLWAAAPALRLFNRYGQTETTGLVTAWPVDQESLQHAARVPIGLPHTGVSFFVVGEDRRLIESPGEVGELYVGGRQLMMGYWRAPELTADVLRTDVVTGETLFRTGDLVHRDEDGLYFCVGRVDRMVKRSGIRISLVELEAALGDLEPVSAAVCVAYDEHGQLGIAAFVTTSAPSTSEELRKAMASLLPTTMLPDRVEIVDQLPMTSGSKVDGRQLLAAAGLRPARPTES